MCVDMGSIMSIKKIHHINFLVQNLQQGINQYKSLLGIDHFIIDDLPGRGVLTARAKVGESWVVLLEPVDMDGVPGQHLQKHGEGFFLISYQVDSLEQSAAHIIEKGSAMTSAESRKGLDNWHIWDINVQDTFGAQIQLCEERDE